MKLARPEDALYIPLAQLAEMSIPDSLRDGATICEPPEVAADTASEEMPAAPEDEAAPSIGGTNVSFDVEAVAGQPTDVGNAARFTLRHGADVRFCGATGKWLIWTGQVWQADERSCILRLAKQTALSIYDEARHADEGRREMLGKWAVTSQRRDRITAMIELSKSELSISPAEMDRDPWLLNVQNGIVDLRTGALRPHRREEFITKICNANYNVDAQAPTLQKFLRRTFRTYPALIPFMRKVFGYSATGLTSEQVLFFLNGLGANGKTTCLDAILYAMGDYAGKADRDLLIASDHASHPTNIADLQGRRIAVCSETDEGRRFDEGRLKDFVGETRIKARVMRGNFFEFIATHKLFLYSNHRPLVRGQDHGFWRRMRVIPFIETIGEDERDIELPEKLKAEADGILAWIVGGCLLWQREGLGLPDEVANATDGYRGEMDSIGLFISECCVFAEKAVASAAELYAAYQRWCVDSGEHPLSQKRLGMKLTERGLVSGRHSYSGRKIWHGIGLKVTENANSAERSFGSDNYSDSSSLHQSAKDGAE